MSNINHFETTDSTRYLRFDLALVAFMIHKLSLGFPLVSAVLVFAGNSLDITPTNNKVCVMKSFLKAFKPNALGLPTFPIRVVFRSVGRILVYINEIVEFNNDTAKEEDA